MAKIIRRTTTITLTQTWTIVWNDDGASDNFRTDDKPQHKATTTVQDQGKTQEESDEVCQTAIMPGEPGSSSTTELPATPPTSAVAPKVQPDNVITKSSAGSKPKRARSRRGAE